MSNAKIWVTFAVPGVHCYPDAPDAVAYLRNPHRHLFQFKVTLEVKHDDRDVEFHLLLAELKGLYGVQLYVDHKSCEMLARELLGYVTDTYPGRFASVTVSEDGECGAEVSNEA